MPPTRPKALVVEDNKADLKYIHSVLKSVRHTFDTATSQGAAMELLDKNTYDYILLDRELPFEPDGIKRTQNGDNLFEQIKRDARHNATRVIIITAYDVSDPDQAVEMVKQGAFDFIAKPFTPARRKSLDKVVQRAASGLTAFHPAWQMTKLLAFIEQYCVLERSDHAKRYKKALTDAVKNGRALLPQPVAEHATGQAAVFFTKDLVQAWEDYRRHGINLPPLKPEIASLF